MNIFIDSNVFLSFYHLSSDELEELKKLAVLIREGQVRLLLPEQVAHEFERNRAGKIADAVKRLRAQSSSLQIPQLGRQYEEYDKLRKAHKELEKNLSKMTDQIEEDATRQSLEADAVVEELFNVAEQIPRSDELTDRARNRMDLGDPPGKKGSLGDAINWEALLDAAPEGEDLYLISDDGDFFSPLDREAIDPYLVNEWAEKKGSDLHPYNRLSSLFRDHFPDIELAAELEKDLLIQQLSASGSFESTHKSVSRLSRYSDFTESQINAIVEAAITNSQIYWIARDPDVNQFLQALVNGREDMIDPENLPKVKYVLDEIEPYGELPS